MKIYKITNTVNNKIYIGKQENNRVDYMGSGLLLHRAYEKYGKENFTKEIIEECDNREILAERERYWISKYNSQDLNIGYNIMSGGDGGDTLSNHPDIDKIREKISVKGKGRQFSEEHRKNLSLASMGNTHGKANKGKPKSEEHKMKISERAKEQWERQKAGGYTRSEETKQKMREAAIKRWAKGSANAR